MKEAIVNWLRANGGRHIEALVIAGALVFGARLYMQEHDARLQADAAIKAAEQNVKSLEAQKVQVQRETQTKVVYLRQQAAAVDTPQKAVAAIPDVAPELKVEPLPDAPERVSVNAVPLFKDLNAGQQCAAELQGCRESLALQEAITGEKDKEVKAAQKKPGFMKRVLKGLKVVGCSAGGAAAGSLTKSTEGAAIGAAAGAALCQAF